MCEKLTKVFTDHNPLVAAGEMQEWLNEHFGKLKVAHISTLTLNKEGNFDIVVEYKLVPVSEPV